MHRWPSRTLTAPSALVVLPPLSREPPAYVSAASPGRLCDSPHGDLPSIPPIASFWPRHDPCSSPSTVHPPPLWLRSSSGPALAHRPPEPAAPHTRTGGLGAEAPSARDAAEDGGPAAQVDAASNVSYLPFPPSLSSPQVLNFASFSAYRRAHERPPPHPHRMHPNYGHGHHIHVPQTMSSHPRQPEQRTAWSVSGAAPLGRGALKSEFLSCVDQQGAGPGDRGAVCSFRAPALPPAPLPPSPKTAPLPLHGESPTQSTPAYVSINERRKSLLNKVGMRLMLLASYL